jgi:hypothetical protein
MKHSRTAVHRKTYKRPALRFADQHLARSRAPTRAAIAKLCRDLVCEL